jgi:alpha-1,6-mannosyltransferase
VRCSVLKREARGALAALALVLVAFALSGGMILGRETSDLLFYVCAFAQSALAVLGARLAARHGASAFAVLVLGAALLRLAFVVQTPTLSGDVYRYIWDGRVIGAGFNPYLHVPADPALEALRDPDQYGLIDKRDYAVTIYPPVAEGIFALVTQISTRVAGMKLAMVLFEAAAVFAIARLLRSLGRPAGELITYLLHPAPIWEIAGNGHVDAAMLAFLYGAFAIGGASRPLVAAIPMTLGALVKPTGALGLPALWRPFQVGLPLFVLAMAALFYLPFARAGTGVIGFLPRYLEEQGLTSGEGVFWLSLLGKAGLLTPGMEPAFAALGGLGLLALALWMRRGATANLASGLEATAVLLVAFLLAVTPTFPWYFLAALPMTPLLGLWSPYALATGGFLLYGFQADAPPFFGRWALLMGLAAAAAIYDLTHAVKEGEA